MSNNRTADLVTFGSASVWSRLIAGIAILVTVGFVWTTGRLLIGDLIATLTRPDDPNAAESAKIALDLAPGDPASRILAGLSSDNPVPALEQAVRLAPADYRWRVELGRALEQAGESDRAGSELKNAVELAPNYSAPHWHLGNFYLRTAHEAEAIAELKKAAKGDHTYREQVFSLAWEIFGRDPLRMEDLVLEPDGLADLSYFLAARGRGDAALKVWNRLSDDERSRRAPLARSIARGLFIQHVFPAALEFSRQLGFDTDGRAEAVTNGSFENSLEQDENSTFTWQIMRNDPKLDISADSKVAHQGSRSLRLTFKAFSRPALLNMIQTIAVSPEHRYRLTFWIRTESLRSSGMPMLELLNANTNETLARSTSFPAGTAEWQQIDVRFRTPAECNGITIRLVRAACGEDCPMTGIAWIDDVELARE